MYLGRNHNYSIHVEERILEVSKKGENNLSFYAPVSLFSINGRALVPRI